MTKEEAIEQLKNQVYVWETECGAYSLTKKALKVAIKALDQAPKTGHWISDGYKTEADWICGRITYKCPFCGYHDNYSNRSNYCPNCGAKLESEE